MSVDDSICRADFCDGASVLERVLLAIINAHTTNETEGRQQERLDAAMMALIGPATQFGHDLERALQFMARQRQRDVCDVEMRALRSCSVAPIDAVRTILELAHLAAREVMGCTSAADVQETAHVLCDMFRRRGNAACAEPDAVREALEAEAVQRIIGELAEWDNLSIRPN
ncbi:hypothetical protein [Pelagibacterium limicola]|uniref:hypothetical protein n=1 Tax=Pelagibacterium limicola TaxID=2791022 RepID=UPI0018AF6B32|nr:hypothetical protein [Pelagibacterium limicola]